MAAITDTVEIARRPEEVFAYLDDLSRHGEWQTADRERGGADGGADARRHARRQQRRTPGGRKRITYEIIEHDPPRKASFRGLDGLIRPRGTVTVEPLDGGARSRVTLELLLEGHGFGKLIVPLVRLDARRHVPKDQARFKERLESGAA